MACHSKGTRETPLPIQFKNVDWMGLRMGNGISLCWLIQEVEYDPVSLSEKIFTFLLVVFFLMCSSEWLCNKSDNFISKVQPSLWHSDPLKSSPGSRSLLVNSVGTTSSCSLLAFLPSVSLASSCLHCLCFSVSISNL